MPREAVDLRSDRGADYAAASCAAAATIWILDRSDVLCMPTSIFQGHALWHLLCALAIFLLYFYYRSEEFDITQLRVYDSLRKQR